MITLQWNLDKMSRSGNSIIGYWLRYPMLEFVNDVNQTLFHISTVYSHFSLIFPRFLACSVHCGAFVQCDGESATDLQAVWYRAWANWIGPEPDSVLRSVRSLNSVQGKTAVSALQTGLNHKTNRPYLQNSHAVAAVTADVCQIRMACIHIVLQLLLSCLP